MGQPAHAHQRGNWHQGQAARQAVHPVDHVEGVDAAHDGENGERHGKNAQVDCAKAEQVAQVFDLYVSVFSHDEGGGNLGDQPDLDTQAFVIIDQADADQQGDGRNKSDLVGLDVNIWQQRHQQCQIDRQAANKGRGGLVLLAVARLVSETYFYGERIQARDKNKGSKQGH